MKTTLLPTLLCVLLLAGTDTNACVLPAQQAVVRDSIVIHQQVTSRSHKVSLYPDASQKVVFFSVKGEEGRAYQLFIFDLEGRLIKQTEIRDKQTTVIREMNRGVYLFDVFSDDVRIGNGDMTVR